MDPASYNLTVRDEELWTVWPEGIVTQADTDNALIDRFDYHLGLVGDDFALIDGGGDGVHGAKGTEDWEGWFASDHLVGAECVALLVGDAVGGMSNIGGELELILCGQDVIKA